MLSLFWKSVFYFFLKLEENVEQKYVQFNIFKPVAEN